MPGVETIRFPVSRLVLDPERFESDANEIMAGIGTTRDTSRDLLRLLATSGDRQAPESIILNKRGHEREVLKISSN